MGNLLLSESAIQQQIVRFYRNSFCLKHHDPRGMIFHVPNQNQHRLAQIGVLSGVSDLVLVHIGKTLFIEVKTIERKKNGEWLKVQSESQIEFQEHCKQAGVQYFLVRSLEEFKRVINYL